jgi:hypothetical protein
MEYCRAANHKLDLAAYCPKEIVFGVLQKFSGNHSHKRRNVYVSRRKCGVNAALVQRSLE